MYNTVKKYEYLKLVSTVGTTTSLNTNRLRHTHLQCQKYQSDASQSDKLKIFNCTKQKTITHHLQNFR